jgi:chitodextrinase
MRRLLASVAALAAVLLAPSAVFAVTQPTITAPASGFATRLPPITLIWTDGVDEVSYHVFRGDAACAGTADVSGALPLDTVTYDDAPPGDGTYCYFIRADGLIPLDTADSSPVVITYDTTPPVITGVTQTGGDGCSLFTLTGVAATDNLLPMTFVADTQPLPYTPPGNVYDVVNLTVVATDAVGNPSLPFAASGRVYDPTPPGATTLEVATDPAAQKATLSWDPVPIDGAPLSSYRLRQKGPQGLTTSTVTAAPVVVQNLQVDATYEFTLDALDACNRFGPSSVRLVRLNDMTPPSMPIVAGPAFNPASHVVTLSWVASTDNIQVDHYEILRDGVPLGATDATVFIDVLPAQHAKLSYVVRAVDTNGNDTDSAPAPIMTPDWTPPTAPVPTLVVRGTTVTLRWPAAADNVGVVGYDVLRDDKQRASMTAAERTYNDIGVPPGVHTWKVRSRDDAQLSAVSAPQTLKISKPRAHASVLSMRLVGGGSGAARYSLKARTRLLLDLRVVGTLPKAKLHLYLSSGRGRITVWRGTPGSSAPRLRLGSRLAHPGFVTVRLSRALHAGHIRLVLIPSGQMVIVGKGAHKPAMTFG